MYSSVGHVVQSSLYMKVVVIISIHDAVITVKILKSKAANTIINITVIAPTSPSWQNGDLLYICFKRLAVAYCITSYYGA